MFGVSIPELLLLSVVVLVVLGPERLPSAIRQLAQLLGQVRRQADAVRRELYNSMYVPGDEIRGEIDEIRENLRTVKSEVEEVVPRFSHEHLTCEEQSRKEELSEPLPTNTEQSDKAPQGSTSSRREDPS
ncbi:Sec-independent protein translocase protein TatB [bacterium]|nr:Sec-independent protein translocase protein TatB [bacterium]